MRLPFCGGRRQVYECIRRRGKAKRGRGKIVLRNDLENEQLWFH
jgi:hypothetical protein